MALSGRFRDCGRCFLRQVQRFFATAAKITDGSAQGACVVPNRLQVGEVEVGIPGLRCSVERYDKKLAIRPRSVGEARETMQKVVRMRSRHARAPCDQGFC